MREFGAVGRVLMVLGVVLLLLGCGFAWREYEFVHTAVRAEATVVGNTKFRAADGSVAYRPIFQFTTADGRKRTGEAETGSHTQGYVPGDRIKVVYLRDDPYGAQMDSFEQLWLMPVGLAGVGAVLLLAGLTIGFIETKTVVLDAWRS